MLDKFIQMQCRNFKIMWLIKTDKDIFSGSDGQFFNWSFVEKYWDIINYFSE